MYQNIEKLWVATTQINKMIQLLNIYKSHKNYRTTIYDIFVKRNCGNELYTELKITKREKRQQSEQRAERLMRTATRGTWPPNSSCADKCLQF